jgi:molybdopterin-guanine dinucleotide biosynthesis protein MobB
MAPGGASPGGSGAAGPDPARTGTANPPAGAAPALPVVSVIGRKNSGKTTLVVALAAELRRRGVRVASVKHSHHDFEIDQPGKDSWRHFHEGGVEAVLVASPHRLAFVMRSEEADRDAARLIERFLADSGCDVVLVEAFKHAAFPRIEVFRTAAHPTPIYDPAMADPAAPYLALVTDAPGLVGAAPFPVLTLSADGTHVAALADMVQQRIAGG